VRLGYEENSAW